MKDFLFEFYFYKTLINTNDEVKKINQFSKKKNNIALFSVRQTMGRGRINKQKRRLYFILQHKIPIFTLH